MAFQFNKINNLFKRDEPSKQSVFTDQTGGDQAPEGMQLAQGAAGQGEVKTSTAGEIGGGAAGSAGPSAPKASAAPPGAQAISRRNAGAVKTPTAFQQIQSGLSGAAKALQDETAAYQQRARGQSYDIGAENVEKAITGDEAQRGAVQGLLAGKGTPRIEAFNPQADVDVEDVELLRETVDPFTGKKTTPGLRSLLQRQFGPEYSGRESQLDLAALERDTEFQKTRQQLVQDQDALRSRAAQAGDISTAEQKAAEQRYADAQNATRALLSQQEVGLKKAQEEELAKRQGEFSRISEMLKTGNLGGDVAEAFERERALAADEYNARVQDPVQKALLSTGRWGNEFLKSGGIKTKELENLARAQLGDKAFAGLGSKNAVKTLIRNLTDDSIRNPYAAGASLASIGEAPTAWEEMLDAGEAQRFNSIMGLLGKSDVYSAGNAQAPTLKFDRDAYYRGLDDTIAQRSKLIDEIRSKARVADQNRAEELEVAQRMLDDEKAAKVKRAQDEADRQAADTARKERERAVAEDEQRRRDEGRTPTPIVSPVGGAIADRLAKDTEMLASQAQKDAGMLQQVGSVVKAPRKPKWG